MLEVRSTELINNKTRGLLKVPIVLLQTILTDAVVGAFVFGARVTIRIPPND